MSRARRQLAIDRQREDAERAAAAAEVRRQRFELRLGWGLCVAMTIVWAVCLLLAARRLLGAA